MINTNETPQADPVPPSKDIFPFLKLPRELRDQIYHQTFLLTDPRSHRALRIERRALKYFTPTPSSILLTLHHEPLLLSRQTAREALEILFKHHTVFLSCGPFVLKTLLERIECANNGPGRHWLRWINSVELDWVTFPNLSHYPPDRGEGRDTWYWEVEQGIEQEVQDGVEVDVDYIRGAAYNGHYDEYDHEGYHYDDNFYDPDDVTLYPSFRHRHAATQGTNNNNNNNNDDDAANDPFGLAHHNPFIDPSHVPTRAASADEIATKLDLLVSMEVTPLFAYLASPTFNISSITLPLYFVSKQMLHDRSMTRPGYALPLKIRYWVQVCVHALLMLVDPLEGALQRVKVKYMPWDVWASMEPADDLGRMVEKGIWFDEESDGVGAVREGEGAAFRAVWMGMLERIGEEWEVGRRMGLEADVRLVAWDGNVDSWRVGDELEVVFTRERSQL
ncbi:hypothetical protein NX059_003920 [Plenodomus lindquistii]|nr:hypothetical protein NX059_003920 [Plenodomus lindquistii]